MKILITGVAGFFGSNLAEYLLNKGHTVVGIDNFNDYYSPKVKKYNIKDFESNPNFKLYAIDLLDQLALDSFFAQEKNIDGVVHLAAWAGVTKSFEIPVVYVRNNVEASVNVLEQMLKNNVTNIVFASTSSAYGKSNPVPYVETMSTDAPLAPYPATKKAVEVMLSCYVDANPSLNATIFRIFNPQGPRMRPDLALPKMIKSVLYGDEFPVFWSNLDPQRDYCHTRHMFDAVLYALEHPFKYEIFNLGNSNPVGLNEVMETVERVTGKKINRVQKPERKGEMEVTYANIDKAKKMLGYNPTTTIEQSIKEYYEWFVQQEEWYKKGEY